MSFYFMCKIIIRLYIVDNSFLFEKINKNLTIIKVIRQISIILNLWILYMLLDGSDLESNQQ